MRLATKILRGILLFCLVLNDGIGIFVVLAGSIDLNRTPSPEQQESMQGIERTILPEESDGKTQSNQISLKGQNVHSQMDNKNIHQTIKRRHRVGGGKSIPMLRDMVKIGQATKEDVKLLDELKEKSRKMSTLRSKRFRDAILHRKKSGTMTAKDEKYYQNARNRYYRGHGEDPIKNRENHIEWVKSNQDIKNESRKRWQEKHFEQERERKKEWRRKQKLKKPEART